MAKKIFSRQEFDNHLSAKGIEQARDAELSRKAIDLLVDADKHDWIHQTSWFGEPPETYQKTLIAFQQIIYSNKPDFFVEVGVAWAGSILMYATIMEALNHGVVIGIDIYIPEDLKKRIRKHKNLAKRIILINGSSTDELIVDKVRKIIGDSKNVCVHLDSNHTHDHVYQELTLYSTFVGTGNYLVCGDTIVEDIPIKSTGQGNGGQVTTLYSTQAIFRRT